MKVSIKDTEGPPVSFRDVLQHHVGGIEFIDDEEWK